MERLPPSLRWLLAAMIPLGALLFTNGQGARQAWGGELWLGDAPARDRVDILYTLHLAQSTWRDLGFAWDAVEGPGGLLSFLLRDLWRVPVHTRVLNMADLPLIWFVRERMAVGPAMVWLNLGLLAMAGLGALAFARHRGAAPAAGAVAGLLAVGSSTLMQLVGWGQYPQAWFIVPLCFFAAMAATLEGAPRAWIALGAAAAFSALLYWQWPLVLGLGALAFALGQASLERPDRERALKLGGAVLLAGLLVLPAALPVAALAGNASLPIPPFGSGYPSPGEPLWSEWPYALHREDALGLLSLVDPRRSWFLPALPALPVLVLGARERRARPWLALVLLGLLMAPGPYPALEDGGEGAFPNPFYLLAWRVVPTLSRFHHPTRFLLLSLVGCIGLIPLGWRAFVERFPKAEWAVAAGTAAWIAFVGPGPLPLGPFPGALERALRPCTEVLHGLPADIEGGRTPGQQWAQMAGIHWRPYAPVQVYGTPLTGDGQVPAALEAWSDARSTALHALMTEGTPADLPSGACVVYDAGLSAASRTDAAQNLRAAFGEPETLTLPNGVFSAQASALTLLVYRVP